MITPDPNTHPTTEIFIGDKDVLMGATATASTLRLWFAPLPPDYSHPLNQCIPVGPGKTEPPNNAAVVVYFLTPSNVDDFIELLKQARSKMN